MQVGVSTACFYPVLTEDAVRRVGELGEVGGGVAGVRRAMGMEKVEIIGMARSIGT